MDFKGDPSKKVLRLMLEKGRWIAAGLLGSCNMISDTIRSALVHRSTIRGVISGCSFPKL